ncbi:DUF2785 domain-containing protein [Weissella coleopterorum]|uniref:DUF2785 domain-containing protein n=1 Tax=Weissella coleopterorum TaxID=2714949 RepID=A0A6G8B1M8_9LACO|nr:DUF2785 domain-containing protein [Weissella coleopterorum]QIL51156.1 DUF2785 domain-containing protein [Weissella coleopterorum]
MVNQTSEVKLEVADLRQRVHAGELLDSLGTVVGKLLDKLETAPSTPVTQFSSKDELLLFARVDQFKQHLMEETVAELTEKDLKILLVGLKQTNPQIRDQGVFISLMQGIQQGAFSVTQEQFMIQELLQDKVLFNHINESENDGAFQRSFAIFLLALLIFSGRRKNVELLNAQQWHIMIEQIGVYIVLERDTRGYVADKGWVHAFTHLGNLLDEINVSPQVNRADKILLETLLVERIKRLNTALVMGEVERMARYMVNLAKMNDLYLQYILNQLKQWRPELMRQMQTENVVSWTRHYNQTHLLSAMLLQKDLPPLLYEYLDEGRAFLI